MKLRIGSIRWEVVAKVMVFILTFGASFHVRAETVAIGVSDGNFDALGVEEDKFVGSLSKYYQCTLDNSGLNYKIRLFPQSRVLYQLERGEIDLGLPLVKVADRDKYAAFTLPMVDIPFLLYSSNKITESDDLSGNTFVIRRSAASRDLIVARNAKFKEVANWNQALLLAKLQRFDGTVIPAVVAKSFNAEDFEGLYQSNFGSIPISIYVSRQIDNTETLVAHLNTAIKGCLP